MSEGDQGMDANRRKLIIVIGVGFVAAVVCTFLFYRMLSGRMVGGAATVQVERTITVAARELPRGTRLRPEDLRTQPFQGAALPDGAFTDPAVIVGSVLTAGVDQDEAVLAVALANKDDDWLASEVPEGMRGVTVHVAEFAGVTQHLQVGDRVDVLVADANRSPGREELQIKTLLQNIEVIATGRELKEDGRPNSIPAVTLLVEARDSQDLSLADQSGAIRLALRNPLDEGTQDTRGAQFGDLLTRRDEDARNTRLAASRQSESDATNDSAQTSEVASPGR